MNARCAIITGVSGQDGAYLARLLLEKGYRVFGATRDPGGTPARLEALELTDRVELVAHPGADLAAWRALLAAHAPQEVYNLAAQSSVVTALRQPYETTLSNAMEPVALFEAARLDRPDLRIFQA
ncbi:MAG: GDP-mannose 4,6-dehydratase, partial [Hyphomicrobiales bacterium]|nr:GDP-mannose 4,6-dehydratase [Hyphomicrobiales bacterium]